jgi:TIR domain/NB-ARC domain/Tetratricopeptide repeat
MMGHQLNDSCGWPVGGVFAFVSYAHEDFAYVRRLVVWLQERGASVWFDEEIPTGHRWESVLKDRVACCAGVVLVMSPHAAASSWVDREVELARSLGKPIMPVLLSGEVIFGLHDVQYESVLDGAMPGEVFVAALPRRSSSAQRLARRRVAHLVGVVPNAADCFQERDLLARLEQALADGGTAVITQVLTGLGGVGKTQLAAALARTLIESASLDVLVWVTARSRTDVVSAYVQAGHEIRGVDTTDPDAAVRELLAWLTVTTGRWLVVLDDVADPADLTGLWPPATRSGRVVVTTRRRDAVLSSHGRLVDVGLFTPTEARTYLSAKFANRPDRLVEADELAADLGYLPLALGQAAAFITDADITCADYRTRLARATTLVDVIPEPSALPDDYRLPVAAALWLSVEAAHQIRPHGLARPLLTMLSLLDPNGIPDTVLTAPATLTYLNRHRPDSTPHVDAEAGRDALSCLARLNVVDRAANPDGQAGRIRVHALVQRATREQTEADLVDEAATTAADALVQIWPQVERDRDLAHLLRANTAALRMSAENQLWQPHAHDVLFRFGQSFGEAGLVAVAVEHFQHLATEATARLGPDHPDALTARNDLAYWRGEAGDVAGAAAALDALLTDRLRVLGPDHPDTLTTRLDLASLRGWAGDMAGAVAALEALLTDQLRVQGPDHPDTLTNRSHITWWRGWAGDAAGAAAALEAVLTDQLRVLGPDHRDTLTTRHDLAWWWRWAGDLAGAAAALEAVLTDQLRVLGPDHRDTLITRHNLARWRGEAGDAAGPDTATEVLRIDRWRLLGPDHPLTPTP